ncbi:Homeodomain-like domain-containing protein [Paraburkholderia silvatlantica]|nr:Homeodomain-like domain-containing protein [Paraburkholderia silvatlantica]PXW27071.1 Homeodomain-like domain-containing protein [Paraburkholderia silvatlantica]
MTIAAELEAQILRLYHVEKWRCGTIARQLHVHHTTVSRVLAQAGLPSHGLPPRATMIEPYLPFIRQTLERFPKLTASRLYAMVRAASGMRLARNRSSSTRSSGSTRALSNRS